MNTVHDEFQAVMDDYTRDTRAARKAVQADRDQQAAILYPDARIFRLHQADFIGAAADGEATMAALPRTLTLVTPDLSDPAGDHLFVGPFAVLSRNLRWNPAHRELTFVTSDGENKISGQLAMTHSRLRAFGTVAIDGRAVAVEYRVDPQRYRMKVAKDAAYLSGQNAAITWDVGSDRWKNATFSAAYEVGFTYGVNGEEVIGDEKVYTFLTKFDDIKTGRRWDPTPFTYSGYMNRQRRLTYGLQAGVKPPTGPGTELFPYTLVCKLSEFGADFTGGMVVGAPGYQGTCYGIIGDWAGRGIAGLYTLGDDTRGTVRVVTVADRTLYVGAQAAESTVFDGDTLTWSGLEKIAADQAGIPTEGSMTFSADGSEVVATSFGPTGVRVHPDRVLELRSRIAVGDLVSSLTHSALLADPAPDAAHDLTELMNMSQYALNNEGLYYDRVQENSMEDFYKILQNYMDPELRRTFFHADPPPLNAELRAIAAVKGTKGTDPFPFFKSLSVPYTATCLGKFSDDPYAKTLNTIRAEQWLSQQTGASDVMAAQAPLLYARRYGEVTSNKSISWFLADQIANAAKYRPQIDAVTEEWIREARENNVGTPEQLAELEKTIRALGEHAKKNNQFWAFALYTATTKPSYLNMMETFIRLGGEVDGSEFSQRVQRTVAVLNVLDTTSYVSQQYAYLLQLFEFSSLLPQMADLAGDITGFQFAVKEILDKFIEKYLDSADPALRDAARQLKEHASQEVVAQMLAILRTTAAVGYGLFNWGYLMAQYQTRCAQLLAGVPALVIRLGAIMAMGTLMSFFLSGTADWNSLPDSQKAFVVLSGVNILAINALALIKRGIALAEVWNPAQKFWMNARMFFSPRIIGQAQQTVTSGLRGYLLQEGGPKVPAARITFKQWWANRQAAAAQPLLGTNGGKTFVRRLFGKNLTRFMARALAGAFAIVGIVTSSIDLANSDEPLERAANAVFLLASLLELVAVIGSWAFAGSAITVGGLLVSSIFAAVAIVAFVALVAGAILLIALMTRPQQTPVEKFAKEQAGTYYMPYRADIESFKIYRPVGEPQLAGISVFATADRSHALRVGSDGKVTQAPFDATGHTAFYLAVDQHGRAQIGAPILDTAGKPVLQSLGVNDNGAIISKDYAAVLPEPDRKLLWYADIQGEGVYQETSEGVRELLSAPFKLRSVYFQDDRKVTHWLATDGASGWRTTAQQSEAATVRLEMVATKPTELTMADVSWLTVAHDEMTGPALQVPGSTPQEWTVSPALPRGITFDVADGTIAMEKGVDVPPAPKREYSMQVANALGSAATTFSLEVAVPANPPTAEA